MPINTLLPHDMRSSLEDYLIPMSRTGTFGPLLPHDGCIKPLQAKWKNIDLEIGSGNGHFLVQKAIQSPKTLYLSIEIAFKRVNRLYEKASKRGLDNIKLLHGDATHILTSIPSNFLNTIYLNFPDPWPKKRHMKRRFFFRDDTYSEIKRCLKPRGEFILATDVKDYAFQVADFLGKDNFWGSIFSPEIVVNNFDSYPRSSYEDKWRKNGKLIYYVGFAKVS